MNRLFLFEEWQKNKICIFHMPMASTQILASLQMSGIPCTIYESADPDVHEDFEANEKSFCGVIISGGMLDPGDELPKLPKNVFKSGIPKLGICLGNEILGTFLGSHMIDCNPATKGEYGEVGAKLYDDTIFNGLDISGEVMVRMEHYKMLDREPEGSKLIASTNLTPVAGWHHEEKKIWGLQFHPEKDWLADAVLKNFYNYCYPKNIK